MQINKEQITEISDQVKLLRSELSESISGMDNVIQSLFVGLVTGGHVLLEGMPGLAKTLVAKNLAAILDAKFSRVQFTPDLLPADLTGTNIFNPKTSSFEIRKGPIFTNILLADEINRAPAKVQSALLQCMEERQVSIADETFDLEPPFFVIATQNPIDQEGTYPLPEAQLDRFLFKVVVTYPSFEDEVAILHQHGNLDFSRKKAKKVIKPKEIHKISEISNKVFVEPKLQNYIVNLTRNTRPETTSDNELKNFIQHGVSPRASLAMLKVSRINALLDGRDFVIPEDIQRFFSEIVKHRLHLSIEAISEDISTDSIIKRILSVTEVPLILLPELKRLLQVLQWETKKKFSSTKQGLLTMSERGRGLDFKEVRNYHYGDDMRYIDWNVTSRTGELYTKEYYEERDTSIIIFYDTSLSLSGTKKNTAYQLALFLSLFHIKMGNRILLIPFSDHSLAPGKWMRTESEILLTFSKLTKQKVGESTNYSEAYQAAFTLYPKYAVSYWISDFNDFSSYLQKNKIPKIWEPIGIWVQDEIDTLKFPFWLRMFQKISEENPNIRSNERMYNDDLKAAKSFFGVQFVQIDPNTKLSNQILPLFRIKRNG